MNIHNYHQYVETDDGDDLYRVGDFPNAWLVD